MRVADDAMVTRRSRKSRRCIAPNRWGLGKIGAYLHGCVVCACVSASMCDPRFPGLGKMSRNDSVLQSDIFVPIDRSELSGDAHRSRDP